MIPWEYIGVDAAHKRDSTAAVSVAYIPAAFDFQPFVPIIRLVDYAIWTPTPGNVVVPEETALPWIRRHIARGHVKAVGYDPAHFETAAVMLRRDNPGLHIEEITASQAHLTAIGSALYDAIRYRRLEVFADATDLRSHVLNAVAVETTGGWRLSKSKERNKVDAAVSLGEAILMANKYGKRDAEYRQPIYIGVPDGYSDETESDGA
jgi:phage terminase large subunit-like protein